MPNWRKVITSGSDATLNSLTVTSGVTGSLFGTSSYAITASYAENGGVTQIIAGTNVSILPLDGKGAVTINATTSGGGTPGGSNTQIQFNDNNSFNGVPTLIYAGSTLRATGSFTGSFTGDLTGTSSYATNSLTASYVASSSYSLNSLNSEFFNGADKNVFITTGSIDTNQTINGSLTITQNLTVLGSSSIQYITSSQLIIADNIISINTYSPGLRYGGIAVIDSGSSPQTSGSLLFDSQNNQWIFVHQNEGSSAVTSSVLIMGPQTFDDVGNELTITLNRLTKGTGGDLGEHIGDSNITDTGTLVSINSATEITGSLTVTQFITGSKFNASAEPVENNNNTQILTRNTTTGDIQYSTQASAYVFNFGLAHAIASQNFLT